MELFAEAGPQTAPAITLATAPVGDPGRATHQLASDPAMGGMRVGMLTGDLPPALGELTWHLTDNSIRDLWIALTWASQT